MKTPSFSGKEAVPKKHKKQVWCEIPIEENGFVDPRLHNTIAWEERKRFIDLDLYDQNNRAFSRKEIPNVMVRL